MRILVIAQEKDGALRKSSREAVTVAKKLGAQTDAFVAGTGNAAQEASAYGADTIYLFKTSEYDAEMQSRLIAAKAKEGGYQAVFFAHDWYGRDISARVAALLDTVVLSDATQISVDGDRVAITRPVYSGKAKVQLKSKGPVAVVSLRSNSFTIEESTGKGEIVEISGDGIEPMAKIVEFTPVVTKRVSLADADRVVTGGRGIKEAANYKLIEDLADILGAATGATRAVVDAGWADHALQVGQTGQTVAPNLYMAIGLSGAIQHLAGMSSSKIIVAVNKDPEAPIFGVATYGIVGDLFEVVPPLSDELKKLLG